MIVAPQSVLPYTSPDYRNFTTGMGPGGLD